MSAINRKMVKWNVSRGNVLLGIAVFVIGCYVIMTREQDSLSAWNGVLGAGGNAKAQVSALGVRPRNIKR